MIYPGQRSSNHRSPSRSGTAPRPSFGGGASAYSAYRKPPTPANQNWRPPPAAANDNSGARPPRPTYPRNPYTVGKIAGMAGAVANAYRIGKLINNFMISRQTGVPRINEPNGAETVCWSSGRIDQWRGGDPRGCGGIQSQATDFYLDKWKLNSLGTFWYIHGVQDIGSGTNRQVISQLRKAVSSYGLLEENLQLPLQTQPWAVPYNPIAPEIYPEIDPFGLPIKTPVQNPMPMPRHWPRPNTNPVRSPQESTVRGPQPARAPAPNLGPRTLPGEVPVTMSPGHTRKPPPKGEKQKKWSEGVAGSLPSQALNAVTEANDVVEALWDALPRSVRRKCSGSMICMAEDIYKNINQLDLTKAIENLLINAVEDAIAGRGIGALQNAAVNAGLNPGAINPGGKFLPGGW